MRGAAWLDPVNSVKTTNHLDVFIWPGHDLLLIWSVTYLCEMWRRVSGLRNSMLFELGPDYTETLHHHLWEFMALDFFSRLLGFFCFLHVYLLMPFPRSCWRLCVKLFLAPGYPPLSILALACPCVLLHIFPELSLCQCHSSSKWSSLPVFLVLVRTSYTLMIRERGIGSIWWYDGFQSTAYKRDLALATHCQSLIWSWPNRRI